MMDRPAPVISEVEVKEVAGALDAETARERARALFSSRVRPTVFD